MNLMILDPTNEAVPVERHISERPKTLTGKVAFLDISKPRGNVCCLTACKKPLNKDCPE